MTTNEDEITIAQAVPILQRVVDDPTIVGRMSDDEFEQVHRAWRVLYAAMMPVFQALASIGNRPDASTNDWSDRWLVDSIAEVLANGGPVDDEREAAHDVAEMLIQARMRVFDALGLTQRHLVKGSEITEERTVWVDQ